MCCNRLNSNVQDHWQISKYWCHVISEDHAVWRKDLLFAKRIAGLFISEMPCSDCVWSCECDQGAADVLLDNFLSYIRSGTLPDSSLLELDGWHLVNLTVCR